MSVACYSSKQEITVNLRKVLNSVEVGSKQLVHYTWHVISVIVRPDTLVETVV